MDRRSFIQSILAASMAPAIVRADSLMRLVVRPSGILVPTWLPLADAYFIPGHYVDLSNAVMREKLCAWSAVTRKPILFNYPTPHDGFFKVA